MGNAFVQWEEEACADVLPSAPHSSWPVSHSSRGHDVTVSELSRHRRCRSRREWPRSGSADLGFAGKKEKKPEFQGQRPPDWLEFRPHDFIFPIPIPLKDDIRLDRQPGDHRPSARQDIPLPLVALPTHLLGPVCIGRTRFRRRRSL